MKKYIFFLAIACFYIVAGNAQDKLRERIYLQTDKQMYLAGEMVWMKLVTTNHDFTPLSFSKIAYVELLNDSVPLLQVKIGLSEGTGEGWMELPATLSTGYYRIVAYTRFMRNEGYEVFFGKNIGIVNTYQSPEITGKEIPGNINNEDDTPNTITLQPDKITYPPRSQGKLVVTGLPEDVHTLSVSITGRDAVPFPENDNIFLRKQQKQELPEFRKIYHPEYEGHIVTGKIVDTGTDSYVSDPIGLPVLSFPGEGIRAFPGRKDGPDVTFFTSEITGMKEAATSMYYPQGAYRVDIQSPFLKHPEKQLPALHIDSAYFGQLLERSVGLQVFHYFTTDSLPEQSPLPSYIRLTPTKTYILDEYTRFTTMRELFIEFITGARFRKNGDDWQLSLLTQRGSYYDYGIPLVLLDGIAISDHNMIYGYDPLVVEKINIYNRGPYLISGYGFDGIIELITYRKDHPHLSLDKSTQIISYEGTQSKRRFYVPDHSREEIRQSRYPDFRHTLLWDPDVQTNSESSVSIPFFTSDFKGEFEITIEGLTKNDEAIFGQSGFDVK